MTVLKGIVEDLRSRRLWPVALVLIVALVAVPVLLSHGASSAPAGQLPTAGTPVSQLPPVPGVTPSARSTNAHLTGPSRDPFTQQKVASATPTTTGTGSTGAGLPGGVSGGGSPGAGGAGTGGATGSGGTPSTPSTGTAPISTPGTPQSITPGAKPKPAPNGLTPTQSYRVSLAITTPSGGLDTIDPLERLSVLPSDQQPLLVELGVLQGGKQVLFAVQPGADVSGPGVCTPGPIDCEVLSLGQDQTEQLSVQNGSGLVGVALFAVTGITAYQHPSVAAANQARRAESAAGRQLIEHSSSTALSLFQYDPSLGAVVDMRNLTVGGS